MKWFVTLLAAAISAACLVSLAGCTMGDLPMREGIEDLAVAYEWVQNSSIKAASPEINDCFGSSLAIHGDWAAAGHAKYNSWDGRVYILRRSGNSWSTYQTLDGPTTGMFASFGTSVALSNDFLFVGAPVENSSDGAVHIYKLVSGSWIPDPNTPVITNGADTGGGFGMTIALGEASALIGAPNYSADAGKAYAFVQSAGVWPATPTNPIWPSTLDRISGDHFGTSIAMDGNWAIVGAPYHAISTVHVGAAYVFYWNGTSWSNSGVASQKLSAADGTSGDLYGISVAIHGDQIAVGASFRNTVYLYGRNGSSWGPDSVRLLDPEGNNTDEFGMKVAATALPDDPASTVVLVGAPRNDAAGSDAGKICFFEKHNGVWELRSSCTALDAAPLAQFGGELAMDGITAMVSPGIATIGASGSCYFLGRRVKE